MSDDFDDGPEIFDEGPELLEDGPELLDLPESMRGYSTDIENPRCGFVALVGAPNAGKSTLLNNLVGGKVSIVTHKVQTTRTRIMGITALEESQVVFIDTPGIFKPKGRLDEAMVEAAWGGASDADIVAFMVDCQKGLRDDEERIIKGLKQSNRRVVLILNKVDLVEKEKLFDLTIKLNEQLTFQETFMISALKGDGVKDLLKYFAANVPEGVWMFPADQMSDLPMRMFAAEVTREKVFLQLHQELPYNSTVETEAWEERKDGSVKINQVIYVARDSQKPIVLGKRGARIKAIGAEARRELQELLERKVHLFLYVKVRENWVNDPERYREMGLDFS